MLKLYKITEWTDDADHEGNYIGRSGESYYEAIATEQANEFELSKCDTDTTLEIIAILPDEAVKAILKVTA